MMSQVGFMQGRLSPIVDGKIQSFPWDNWQNEIILAKKIGLNLMEWTLDQERLYENPLMTLDGQKEILSLCKNYNFFIPSLTGDCFMQAPFWKASDQSDKDSLQEDFLAILNSCSKVGIRFIVVPLVDNGSLSDQNQEDCLVEFLHEQEDKISNLGIKIIFESDFKPANLLRFISRLSKVNFGINYDIGNSSALGFNPVKEFQAIGNRIFNVHVKDRPLNGTTVPLGDGDANFPLVFELLHSYNYSYNYILQTARAKDGDHSSALSRYNRSVKNWMNNSGS
tara:strand:- start:1762 stop:2604 length:843 start_codon:yes stop_codon:yes gene_type:complete